MTEILFYHLTELTLENALPGLVERSLDTAVEELSSRPARRSGATVWIIIYGPGPTLPFWPMARIRRPHPEEQPVILTTTDDSNPECVQLCGSSLTEPTHVNAEAYERLVLMFDGHDQQQLGAGAGAMEVVERPRAMRLTYWQQNAEGRLGKEEGNFRKSGHRFSVRNW